MSGEEVGLRPSRREDSGRSAGLGRQRTKSLLAGRGVGRGGGRGGRGEVEADAREGRGEAPGGQGVIFIILSLLMMSFGVLVFAPGVALPPVGVRGEGRRGHVVVANPRKRNVRRFLATHATSALPLQHALHLILYYFIPLFLSSLLRSLR